MANLSIPNPRVVPSLGGAGINVCKGALISTLLAANVPSLITVPTYTNSSGGVTRANNVIFSPDSDIWVNYVDENNSELTELVTNGDFTSSAGWTQGSGWSIAANVATASSASSALSRTPSKIVDGQYYYVTFTVSSYSTGNVTPSIGGTTGTSRSANGTYSEFIKAGSGSTIALTGASSFSGVIDNFSAIPCAYIPTALDESGRASELNPAARDISGISAISIISASAAKVSLAFYKG
jgi:hypothetical protein